MKLISRILQDVAKAKTEAAKIKVLQANDSVQFRMLLGMVMDKRMVWCIPETPPPYKPLVAVDNDNHLYASVMKMYLFFKVWNPMFGDQQNHELAAHKREGIFIRLLEAVDPKDAEFLVAALQKKFPIECGLTPAVLNKAWGTSMPED